MKCEDARRLIDRTVTGSDAEEAALAAHLAQCPDCRALADTERRIRLAFGAERELRPSRALQTALLAVPSRERRLRRLVPLALPLTGLICVAATLLTWQLLPRLPFGVPQVAQDMPTMTVPASVGDLARKGGLTTTPAPAATVGAKPGTPARAPAEREPARLAIVRRETATQVAVGSGEPLPARTPVGTTAGDAAQAPRPSAIGGGTTASPTPVRSDDDAATPAPPTAPGGGQRDTPRAPPGPTPAATESGSDGRAATVTATRPSPGGTERVPITTAVPTGEPATVTQPATPPRFGTPPSPTPGARRSPTPLPPQPTQPPPTGAPATQRATGTPTQMPQPTATGTLRSAATATSLPTASATTTVTPTVTAGTVVTPTPTATSSRTPTATDSLAAPPTAATSAAVTPPHVRIRRCGYGMMY